MTPEERFESLWTDYLEGELDDKGHAELRALLDGHEALRRRAVDLYQTHRSLGFLSQENAAVSESFVQAALARLPRGRESFVAGVMRRISRRDARPWWANLPAAWRYGLAAGAAAALTLAATFLHQGAQGPLQPEETTAMFSTRDDVATVLFADDCEWDGLPFNEGQRLRAGPLKLRRGLAVLRFDGGAAVVLTGEVDFVIESRGSAQLRRGQVVVRAPEEAAGFIVRTPGREVVDLGTEFTVKVEKSGALELHVTEGEIAHRPPNAEEDPGELLKAGAAVRFDRADTATPRTVPLAAPRFAQLLQKVNRTPEQGWTSTYEGFDYTPGLHPMEECKGGWGWLGPWRQQPSLLRKPSPNKPSELNIDHGKLNVTWPVHGGLAGMLAMPANSQCARTLKMPIRLDEDGVRYFSVMMRVPPATPGQPAKEHTSMAFRLASGDLTERVGMGLPPSNMPTITIRNGVHFTGSTPVRADQTMLWVGKIVSRKAGEDEVFLRMFSEDEPLEMFEPKDWSVSTRGIYSDGVFDVVVFAVEGEKPRLFDEFRTGTVWRAVLPPDRAAAKK